MDGGAWWAAVHGAAKSRTRLSDFTFTFYFHALGKEMATHSSVLAWRIPGTEELGVLQSLGLHRVGHDWSDLAAAAAAELLQAPPVPHSHSSSSGHLCFLIVLPAFQMNSGTLLQPLISVVSNSASKVSVWCVYIFKDKIINANKLTICESSRQDFKMCEIMSAMWLKFDKISKTADYHCTAFMFCWREGIFI